MDNLKEKRAEKTKNRNFVEEAFQKKSQGQLGDWITDYLTNVDPNPEFVEGISKRKRWWVGPQEIDISFLKRICGPEEGIEHPETKERWDFRINQMLESINFGWIAPPIIVQYTKDGLLIRDGNHRQEALLRKGVTKYPTVVWFDSTLELQEKCRISPDTFFLTGTSGAGKTSIVESIKNQLPFIDVHDFDEGGVPSDADDAWRQERTNSWVKKAQINREKGIVTLFVEFLFQMKFGKRLITLTI